MSLISDPDYFIQALKLNYLRHVVPNHASPSAIPGTCPYNLITFDPNSREMNSPHVILSGMADETQWPELLSGRSSPPLAPLYQRAVASGELRVAGTGREVDTLEKGKRGKANGAIGLNYSQTIGARAVAAGMRVDGRSRSYKMKNDPDTKTDTPGEENRVRPPLLNRSTSLEASIHHRRLAESQSQSSVDLPAQSQHTAGAAAQLTPVLFERLASTTADVNNVPNLQYAQVETLSQSVLQARSLDEDYGESLAAPPIPLVESLFDRSKKQHHEEDPWLANEAEGVSNTFSTRDQEDSIRGYPKDRESFDFTTRALSQISETDHGRHFLRGRSESDPSGQSLSNSFPILSSSPNQNGTSQGSDSDSLRPPRSPLSGEPITSLPSQLISSATGGDQVRTSHTSAKDGDTVMPLSVRFAVDHESKLPEKGQPPALNIDSIEEGSSASPAVHRSPSKGQVSSGAESTRSSAYSSDEDSDFPKAQKTETLAPHANHFRPRERRRVNIKAGFLLPPNPSKVPKQPEGLKEIDGAASRRSSVRSDKRDATSRPSTPMKENSDGVELNSISDTMVATVNGSLKAENAISSVITPSTDSLVLPGSARHEQSVISFPTRAQRTGICSQTVPKKSALTAILSSQASSSTSSNPFTSLYAALISKGTDALNLALYFPHSSEPRTKVNIYVKRDLTVEEVLGVGLWTYYENRTEPHLELDDELNIDKETTKWNLRIVEDDGEVDDDFPALDRAREVSAFAFGEFAVVKATPKQVQDNRIKQATIIRRPSRILAGANNRSAVGTNGNLSTIAPMDSQGFALASSPRPTANSTVAVPVLLRIRLPPQLGLDSLTTLEVLSTAVMSDVLDQLCREVDGLDKPELWAFVVELQAVDMVVPLNQTVNSLGDQRNIVLVDRSQLAIMDMEQMTQPRNGGPGASIFKGQSSFDPSAGTAAAPNLTSTYQKYTVLRKLPMPLGKHPRNIAIDGDYIHIMPSDTKGLFDGGRTASYHISNVRDCKISKRHPTSFKLVVQKDRYEKRYDFEADSTKQAIEIVGNIRGLMGSFREMYERGPVQLANRRELAR